jgi:hypothetical protein
VSDGAAEVDVEHDASQVEQNRINEDRVDKDRVKIVLCHVHPLCIIATRKVTQEGVKQGAAPVGTARA